MKMKIIEAAVLLGLLFTVMSCDLWHCLGLTRVDKLVCEDVKDTKGNDAHVMREYTKDPIDGEWSPAKDQQIVQFPGRCSGGTTPEGGAQPNPNSGDTVPKSSSVPAGSTGVRHRNDAAGSGSTAGGFLPVPLLNLPFTALSPSSAPPSSAACTGSEADIVFVNHDSDSLTRFSTCPLAVKAEIPVGAVPTEVVVTPDARQALVTNYEGPSISFVDLQNNTVSSTLNTGTARPAGLAISPDGKTAYVSSFAEEPHVILVIDIPTRTIRATIQLSALWPNAVALTPDGAQLWVAHPYSAKIAIIDTLTNTVARTIFVVKSPQAIDFSPNGAVAYVADAGTTPGTVAAIDTKTYKLITSYAVGTQPADVRVDYGGATISVTNYGSNSLSTIFVRTGQVVTSPTIDGAPVGLAEVR